MHTYTHFEHIEHICPDEPHNAVLIQLKINHTSGNCTGENSLNKDQHFCNEGPLRTFLLVMAPRHHTRP